MIVYKWISKGYVNHKMHIFMYLVKVSNQNCVQETFAAFDQANKGYITADGLDKVLKNIGFNFTVCPIVT